MKFPTLVYKDGGDHQRPGGTFSFKQVRNEADFIAATHSGWKSSLAEVISPVKEVVVEDAPTRDEIETKATELGIKFDGRTKDATLLKKIEEALAK